MNLAEVMTGLTLPTPIEERRYRIGRILNEDTGLATVLTYVDARYVMDVLDEIVGSDKWSNEFVEIKGNLFCRITICCGDLKVSKMDVGVPSNFEKEKGEASDAFKRCAVHFGIGRDLYHVGTIHAECKRTTSGQWVLPKDFSPFDDNERKMETFEPSDSDLDEARDLLSSPAFEDKRRDSFERWIEEGNITRIQWNSAVRAIKDQIKKNNR